METNESTELLTDEDIVLINNFVEKPNLKLLIFMIFFTGLSYLGSLMLDTYLPMIIFASLSLGVAAWYFWMKFKINEFTKSGTKKIISGIIENKIEKRVSAKTTQKYASSNYTFGFFLINNTEYVVPYSDFASFNTGDRVKLHLTIKDDIVFKVTNDK